MKRWGRDAEGAPWGVRRLVLWTVGSDRATEVLGDLRELAQGPPPAGSVSWYWWQAITLVFRVLAAGRTDRQRSGARRGAGGGWAADVRFAFRSYRRTPVLAAAILTTLTLGVGATTAIFSVVDAVIIRPLPFREPDRLVLVWETEPNGGRLQPFSPPNLEDLRASATTLSEIGGWVYERYAVTGSGDAEEVLAVRVTEGFFEVLGATATLGRTFDAAEEADRRAVVLSHAYWTARFGGDRGVLGRTLVLDHEPYEVVGVMGPAFRFPDRDDVAMWIPQVRYPWEEIRHTRNTSVIARLAPGATPDQVNDEIGIMAAALSEDYPDTNAGWGARVQPADVLSGDASNLVVLLAAVGLVLLIACVNVSNLLLARASDRHRELAVRRSLGASRIRIVRQLMIEGGLLAVLGSSLGVALAAPGTRALLSLEPGALPAWNRVDVDGRVLVFAAALTVLITVSTGLLPAVRASRERMTEGLHDSGRWNGPTRSAAKTRSLLSVVEVALSVVLLAGAGLLVTSMIRLTRVDPGFRPDGLVTATLELPETRYEYGTGAMEGTFESILSAVRGIPGVSGAGWVTTLPMNPVGTDYDIEFYLVEHPDRSPTDAPPQADFRVASGGYFEAMGIPLVAGRTIRDSDRSDTQPVAVVNQTFADRFFPGESPLGERVQVYTPEGAGFEIIGVVGNVRHRGLDDTSRPELYLPYQQMTHGEMTLAVRSALETGALVRGLKEAVARVDADLPLIGVSEAPSLLDDSVADRRFHMILLLCFAGLGLTLAVVGVYGTTSYSVSRRRHEIGIRMAVGAARADVRRLVLGQGLRLASTGIALGLLGAVLLTQTLQALLFGVAPVDPLTFGVVVGVVALSALLACWLPARRAARVEPTQALRESS